MELLRQHVHRAQAPLHRFRLQFGDLGGRPKATSGVRTAAYQRCKRHAAPQHWGRETLGAFDVHELDGPNLSGFRDEDVNLESPVPVVDTTYRLAAEPVATTRLDTGYDGVRAGQEQGGV